jgi:hypothetical protein
MRRDERVHSLSKQLEWFRTEALSLSKICEQLKKENKDYSTSVQTLNEELSFMTEQLKN